MKTISKQKDKTLKAEITVVLKTCELMSNNEFSEKYHDDIEAAISDILRKYSLFEIVENDYKILNAKVSD